MKKEERIENKDLTVVDAEFVNVSQSTVRSVEGGHVELEQVLALSIDADRVDATQTGAMIVRSQQINLNQGISMLTAGQDTEVNSSFTPVTFSVQKAELNNCLSGITVAREVKAEGLNTILLVSNKVEGSVKTVFDWKGVVALGAITTGLLGLLSILKK